MYLQPAVSSSIDRLKTNEQTELTDRKRPILAVARWSVSLLVDAGL